MNELLKIISADVKANRSRLEVIFFLFVFRLGSYFKQLLTTHTFGILFLPLYFLTKVLFKVLSTVYLMEMPLGTKIGKALKIYHLKGIVINEDSILGDDVTLNHFITIADEIIIKDGVVINPQSVIVKGIIGKNAVVGAGSVVTKDVAENTIVAGCPAKKLGK